MGSFNSSVQQLIEKVENGDQNALGILLSIDCYNKLPEDGNDYIKFLRIFHSRDEITFPQDYKEIPLFILTLILRKMYDSSAKLPIELASEILQYISESIIKTTELKYPDQKDRDLILLGAFPPKMNKNEKIYKASYHIIKTFIFDFDKYPFALYSPILGMLLIQHESLGKEIAKLCIHAMIGFPNDLPTKTKMTLINIVSEERALKTTDFIKKYGTDKENIKLILEMVERISAHRTFWVLVKSTSEEIQKDLILSFDLSKCSIPDDIVPIFMNLAEKYGLEQKLAQKIMKCQQAQNIIISKAAKNVFNSPFLVWTIVGSLKLNANGSLMFLENLPEFPEEANLFSLIIIMKVMSHLPRFALEVERLKHNLTQPASFPEEGFFVSPYTYLNGELDELIKFKSNDSKSDNPGIINRKRELMYKIFKSALNIKKVTNPSDNFDIKTQDIHNLPLMNIMGRDVDIIPCSNAIDVAIIGNEFVTLFENSIQYKNSKIDHPVKSPIGIQTHEKYILIFSQKVAMIYNLSCPNFSKIPIKCEHFEEITEGSFFYNNIVILTSRNVHIFDIQNIESEPIIHSAPFCARIASAAAFEGENKMLIYSMKGKLARSSLYNPSEITIEDIYAGGVLVSTAGDLICVSDNAKTRLYTKNAFINNRPFKTLRDTPLKLGGFDGRRYALIGASSYTLEISADGIVLIQSQRQSSKVLLRNGKLHFKNKSSVFTITAIPNCNPTACDRILPTLPDAFWDATLLEKVNVSGSGLPANIDPFKIIVKKGILILKVTANKPIVGIDLNFKRISDSTPRSISVGKVTFRLPLRATKVRVPLLESARIVTLKLFPGASGGCIIPDIAGYVLPTGAPGFQLETYYQIPSLQNNGTASLLATFAAELTPTGGNCPSFLREALGRKEFESAASRMMLKAAKRSKEDEDALSATDKSSFAILRSAFASGK